MVRVSNKQAADNRRQVVGAASTLLRAKGLFGVGVRELMAAAGLTQGAFARQFGSKDALAAEACNLAFDGTEKSFASVLGEESSGRSRRLVEYYLGPKPADEKCPIAALSVDIARLPNGSQLHEVFSKRLERVIFQVAGDPQSPEKLLLFAAMIGASVLGGAVLDKELKKKIETAVLKFSEQIE
jgi:TetR/AcrR family transcriptional repressor of nem operon